MKAKISLSGLILSLFIIVSCGGGGGGSSDVIPDNQNNQDPIDDNNDNGNISQFDFIKVLDENYTLKQIMPADLGLPLQIALLPTGELVVADTNYSRISIISNNTAIVIADEDNINVYGGVTTLPDGRICYSLMSGQLILLNPDTGAKSTLGYIPDGERSSALAIDKFGNIYAASNKQIFRFGLDGFPVKIADNLPYDVEWAITDMDIDPDGIIYIAGSRRVLRVSHDGSAEIIADGLNIAPVFVAVAMDGSVYINDAGYGLQKYNPIIEKFEEFRHEGLAAFGDILFSADDEIIFYDVIRAYFKLNLTNDTVTPLLIIPGNAKAFAVNGNNTAFFATPNKPPFLDSHMISLTIDGVKEDLLELTYDQIYAADVDKNNRLCLSTNEGFIRIEQNNSITTINPIFESEAPFSWIHYLAAGPDNKWYVISTDYSTSYTLYSFDDSGKVEFLPIVFDKATFGGAYSVRDGSIDIGNDGRIAIIVTAIGSRAQGPFYQRVYTADSDGGNLTEIANLDSNRDGGPVDIAFVPDGDIFVLSVQDHGDNIYRIDHQSHVVTEFIWCDTGHDPMSMDVDTSGNVWITTTQGIFMAGPKK